MPQGSVLCVRLFAIPISGMVNTVELFVATSYVDITVYCSSRSIATLESQLQDSVNHLSQWATENGFSLSPHKTQSVHIHLRCLHPQPSLVLSNQTV